MDYVGREQRRVDALRCLGLERMPSDNVLRAAWKRRVLETHPDSEGGSAFAFRQVQAAFEFLKENGTPDDASVYDDDFPAMPMTKRPRRGIQSSRIIHFSAELRQQCQAALSHHSRKFDTCPSLKTPTSIQIDRGTVRFLFGEHLTPSEMLLALPVKNFSDPASALISFVKCRTNTEGFGVIDLGTKMMRKHFPRRHEIVAFFAGSSV